MTETEALRIIYSRAKENTRFVYPYDPRDTEAIIIMHDFILRRMEERLL